MKYALNDTTRLAVIAQPKNQTVELLY